MYLLFTLPVRVQSTHTRTQHVHTQEENAASCHRVSSPTKLLAGMTKEEKKELRQKRDAAIIHEVSTFSAMLQ
jgi:hypothetical protein